MNPPSHHAPCTDPCTNPYTDPCTAQLAYQPTTLNFTPRHVPSWTTWFCSYLLIDVVTDPWFSGTLEERGIIAWNAQNLVPDADEEMGDADPSTCAKSKPGLEIYDFPIGMSLLRRYTLYSNLERCSRPKKVHWKLLISDVLLDIK